VGWLNAAALPSPLDAPGAPAGLPASVDTTPYKVVTARSRLPVISDTNRVAPAASRAAPQGLENVAKAPGPSAPPGAPVPASVDTAPPASTRTLLFALSTMNTAPVAGATATDAGRLKLALSAGPSAAPATPVPASVLTAPEATATALIAWFV
jgi:hypothetical protein